MTSAPHTVRFCPACGGDAFPPVSPNAFRCRLCGFELFLNVASAVAALIVDESGRLLLVQRAREPAMGSLDLPGGFVDAGETAQEALRRELLEELGCEVSDFRFFGSFPNLYPYGGVTYHTLDLAWLVTVSRPEGISVLDSEISGIVWMPPSDIPMRRIGFSSIRNIVSAWIANSCP